MNDIPRDTPRMEPTNFLLTPSHDPGNAAPVKHQPDIIFGLVLANSRLGDGLSVATIIRDPEMAATSRQRSLQLPEENTTPERDDGRKEK